MPTPKAISDYHEFFFVVCRSALLAGKLTLTYPNPDAAFRARRRFYAFREAVYSKPDYEPDLTNTIPRLKFEVDGAKLVLLDKTYQGID